jgi:hypothetical protein
MRIRSSLAVLAGSTVLLAATAQAAEAKTVKLFSKSIPGVGGFYGPDGKPASGQPVVGSYFIGADNDYRGTHAKHSRKPVAWDHVVCTVLDPTTFTVRCDIALAFPRGVMFADEQVVSFMAPTQKFKITGGTGAYKNAKGATVTAHSIPNSDNSDLTIRF